MCPLCPLPEALPLHLPLPVALSCCLRIRMRLPVDLPLPLPLHLPLHLPSGWCLVGGAIVGIRNTLGRAIVGIGRGRVRGCKGWIRVDAGGICGREGLRRPRLESPEGPSLVPPLVAPLDPAVVRGFSWKRLCRISHLDGFVIWCFLGCCMFERRLTSSRGKGLVSASFPFRSEGFKGSEGVLGAWSRKKKERARAVNSLCCWIRDS